MFIQRGSVFLGRSDYTDVYLSDTLISWFMEMWNYSLDHLQHKIAAPKENDHYWKTYLIDSSLSICQFVSFTIAKSNHPMETKSLWWYQHQSLQFTNHFLQLHLVGQSLPVPPLQQQSLGLKKQPCSLRCWERVGSLGAVMEPLGCGDVVADRPLHLEPDPVGLRGATEERGGVQSILQPLSSSVLSFLSTALRSFLDKNYKA